MQVNNKKQEIWLGDCLELMRNIPDKAVDFILIDPPFGVTIQKWDKIVDFQKMWCQIERVRKETCSVIIFGTEPFSTLLRISNLSNFRYDWIWHKSKPSGMAMTKKQPMRNHEILSCFYQGNFYPIKEDRVGFTEKSKNRFSKKENLGSYKNHGDSITGLKETKLKKIEEKRNPTTIKAFGSLVNRNGKNLHPTQKPLELCEYMIKTYSQENDLVLDCFAGSGTTLVAAKNLNRQFIGIEKEEKYYNIILERLKNAN